MCGTILAVALLLAKFVAAQSGSSINQIYRPLNEAVPACKPFSISWQPTTNSTVSLTLLRGALGNSVIVATLAGRIPNSGIYIWTPESNLEADASLYLIQLTDDATGEYQISSQFGISKGPECATMSDPIPSASPTPSPTSFLTSVSAAPSTSLPIPQPSFLPPSQAAEPKRALSTGAKIGIGVAVSAFVLLLLAIGFWLRRRRRTRHAAPAEMSPAVPDCDASSPTFYGFMSKSELDSTKLTELSAEEPEAPLLDSTTIVELPTHGLATSPLDSTTSVARSSHDSEKCGLESVTVIQLPAYEVEIAELESPVSPLSPHEFVAAELDSAAVFELPSHHILRSELDDTDPGQVIGDSRPGVHDRSRIVKSLNHRPVRIS
ncbi:hypothetical protein FB567DRAFT_543852 [Paraphoma chrysanthemicola]|uniref:Yeast cell wall synthesis Kre9/Knh1-like N-terminal domain-containing protein n=1 Tax=Paraphoma chrysanthemicola TaxID=798071 RepID=A0A8K0RIQ7_9PLEO|nr:hypothetical protein FB567DRAFT_543852 [Paraphoma chrysanthemicola]